MKKKKESTLHSKFKQLRVPSRAQKGQSLREVTSLRQHFPAVHSLGESVSESTCRTESGQQVPETSGQLDVAPAAMWTIRNTEGGSQQLERSPRDSQPPHNCFPGKPPSPILGLPFLFLTIRFRDLPAAPDMLSKPPPCHSVCFLPDRACHSSRREGMHAIRLNSQMGAQRELHRRMSTNKHDSGFASAGMKKGLDASIRSSVCQLGECGLHSMPEEAAVGVYGQAHHDEINGLKRFIWQPSLSWISICSGWIILKQAKFVNSGGMCKKRQALSYTHTRTHTKISLKYQRTVG